MRNANKKEQGEFVPVEGLGGLQKEYEAPELGLG